MRGEYRYGVDLRCNVGFGFLQMAYGVKAPLTLDNLWTVYSHMRQFKADGGRPLGIKPKMLCWLSRLLLRSKPLNCLSANSLWGALTPYPTNSKANLKWWFLIICKHQKGRAAPRNGACFSERLVMNKLLFIRSKNRQGFRRAGEFFTSEGKMMDRSNFTESQWEQIKAEPLLTVIEEAAAPVDDTPSELIENIVEAIGMMNPDKKPPVKDLENILGQKVTAEQRNTAWDIYQARVAEGG